MSNYRVPVNLENYPHLLNQILQVGPEKGIEALKEWFRILDTVIAKGYPRIVEEKFGYEFGHFVLEVLEGVLDTKGILGVENQQIGESQFNRSGHNNHPLALELDDEEFKSKFGMERKDFTVSNWLKGLIWYQAYHRPEYLGTSRAMRLPSATLMDYSGTEIAEQIARILQIQPTLNYQESHGIPVGQLIPGTGLLDVGEVDEEMKVCTVCHIPDTLFQTEQGRIGCKNCKAGWRANP